MLRCVAGVRRRGDAIYQTGCLLSPLSGVHIVLYRIRGTIEKELFLRADAIYGSFAGGSRNGRGPTAAYGLSRRRKGRCASPIAFRRLVSATISLTRYVLWLRHCLFWAGP